MTTGFLNGSYFTGSTATGRSNTTSIYDTNYLDRKYNYQHTNECYENMDYAEDSVLDSKIRNILTFIENGKEDKAIEAYNKLIEEMGGQTRYAQLSQSEIKAMARQMIESQLEDGETLDNFIRENTANSFERGFEINWDGDKYQEEDVLREICDLDETTTTDGLKKAGGTACKVLAGAGAIAAGIAVGCLTPLGLIGGVVAGGAALALNIFRK